MSALALMIKDDHFGPEPWTLLSLCGFLPSLVIFFSWAVIRWKKGFVVLALLAAGIAAVLIASRVSRDLQRWELYRTAEPNPPVVEVSSVELAAPWFAALFPFAMIALFYFTAKGRTSR
jgi:hypothetical protein